MVKPNILFILTDQQTRLAMSAAGNPYLKTPAIDRIATSGVMFTQSYCNSPVCGPSRSSLLTGRMPHETGVVFNRMPPDPTIPNIGQHLRQHGYNTAWAGKWHNPVAWPGPWQNPEFDRESSHGTPGFELLLLFSVYPKAQGNADDVDARVADCCVQFLLSEPQEPFLLCASFDNPHDICDWPIDHEEPRDWPDVGDYPPVPDNFAVDPDEPDMVQMRRKLATYGTHSFTARWTEAEFRAYLHAYYRFIEMADRQIGRVLTALDDAGLFQKTLIIFTSDHGDGAAGHRWVQKLCLYEEPVGVPLLVSFPDAIPAGVVDRDHLTSNVDIFPTMCDYGGIKPPQLVRGRSVRPIIEQPMTAGHAYVVSELWPDREDHRHYTARMLRTARYKYNVYSHGARAEQLFDLQSDPGETTNLAADPKVQTVLDEHRRLLNDWIERTGDPFQRADVGRDS